NIALVQIDRWVGEYVKAFETNPDRQNVAAAGQRFPTDQYGVVRDPESVGRTAAVVPEPPAAMPRVLPAPQVAAAAAAPMPAPQGTANDAYLTPTVAVPTHAPPAPAPSPV